MGPARTTVSGIADEAGVQRATVYRHFPNEKALFEACTGHYLSLHPRPDPSSWVEIADPSERLREALGELYRWWDETEDMMSRVIRDASLVPSMEGAARDFFAYFEEVRTTLMRGRRQRGKARARLAAAIGHAIAFSTWQSLAREQGLTNSEAVELMSGMVERAA